MKPDLTIAAAFATFAGWMTVDRMAVPWQTAALLAAASVIAHARCAWHERRATTEQADRALWAAGVKRETERQVAQAKAETRRARTDVEPQIVAEVNRRVTQVRRLLDDDLARGLRNEDALRRRVQVLEGRLADRQQEIAS